MEQRRRPPTDPRQVDHSQEGFRRGAQATNAPVGPGRLIPGQTQPASRNLRGQIGSQAEETAGEPVMRMQGVYIISVAARILDMHPQTLRKYERLGLINPGRTIGMLRLYSAEDIRKVRLIRHLVDRLGFNLAGVEHTLSMVDALLTMKQRLIGHSESGAMADLIEQEITRFFRNMNLPVEE